MPTDNEYLSRADALRTGGHAMSDELSNATRIAALEEQVRQLTADAAAFNSILKRGQEWMNSAHDSWQRMCNQREEAREALTKALADNATLNTAKDRLIDERNACLRELDAARQELADRNAYAERLLAENVRLSNEAADVRKELEKYQDSLEVMTTDNNATFEGINAALDAAGITFLDVDTYAACIGRLAAQLAERNAYAERLLAENVRLSNEAAFMRGFINNEDVRSDFQTVTAMRQALDRERERCGVLEREVRAWHAAEGLRKDEPHNEFMRLAEARFRTRETHALDPAKFVPKEQP